MMYPEKLPKTNCQIPIYTILNCSSESVARSKYGNIFIRKVTTNQTDSIAKRRVSVDAAFDSLRNINILDEFNKYASLQNPPLSKDIIEECRNLLKSRSAS